MLQMTASSPSSQTKAEKTTSPYCFVYSFYLRMLELHWYFPPLKKKQPSKVRTKEERSDFSTRGWIYKAGCSVASTCICGTNAGASTFCSLCSTSALPLQEQAGECAIPAVHILLSESRRCLYVHCLVSFQCVYRGGWSVTCEQALFSLKQRRILRAIKPAYSGSKTTLWLG